MFHRMPAMDGEKPNSLRGFVVRMILSLFAVLILLYLLAPGPLAYVATLRSIEQGPNFYVEHPFFPALYKPLRIINGTPLDILYLNYIRWWEMRAEEKVARERSAAESAAQKP
jgi:hypothetical protein